MRHVLDTNVASALRVCGRNRQVEHWATSVPSAELFITALTISELERRCHRQGTIRPHQGVILRRWFEERVLPAFADRILPFGLTAARILATYRVPEHAPQDDALIAAITQAADMTVITRTTRHFEPLGVARRYPWHAVS